MSEQKDTSGNKSEVSRDLSQISKNSSKHATINHQQRRQVIRQVNDYLVFCDEVLGVGQYGKVVKAVKQAPRSTASNQQDNLLGPAKAVEQKAFACKIIEVQNVSKEDMACIVKEVQIHSMVHSQYAVRLYQTIKTKSNIYMFQDFCNGCDLSLLLRLRGKLKQCEARLIMIQLAIGLQDIWQLQIIHRDMKLANILLNFPDNPEMNEKSREQKKKFLRKVDLTKINFEVKISDFGLSTILDSNQTNLSICGTPLYSSPQLLLKKGYNAKVDTWALGVIVYELLVGTTPFHSFEMKDLLNKIKIGKYSLTIDEPLIIESVLFLVQCLQANEDLRISKENLHKHPFIDLELTETPLNVEVFYKELNSQGLTTTTATDTMTNNSDKESLLMSNNCINLTTKGTEQEQILLGMLVDDSLGLSFNDLQSSTSNMSARSPNQQQDNKAFGPNSQTMQQKEESKKHKSLDKSNLQMLEETMDKKKMQKQLNDQEETKEELMNQPTVKDQQQDQQNQSKDPEQQKTLAESDRNNNGDNQMQNSLKESSRPQSIKNSKDPKLFNNSHVSDDFDKEVEQQVEANKRRNPIGRFFGYMTAKMCRTNQSRHMKNMDGLIENNTALRIRESIKERRPSHRGSKQRNHTPVPVTRTNDIIEQSSPKFARPSKDL